MPVGFSLKVYMIAEDRERRAVDAAAELVDFRDVDRDDFDAGCFEMHRDAIYPDALFGKILCTYFLYTFCSTDAMISSRHISKVRTIWIEMHKKILIHR